MGAAFDGGDFVGGGDVVGQFGDQANGGGIFHRLRQPDVAHGVGQDGGGCADGVAGAIKEVKGRHFREGGLLEGGPGFFVA